MSEPTSPTPTSTPSSEPTETSTEPTASANLPPAEIEGGLSADIDAISDLFAREPDSWTEADMVRMVTELRKRRVELDAPKPEKVKAAKTPKAAKPPAVKLDAVSGMDLLSKLGLGGKS